MFPRAGDASARKGIGRTGWDRPSRGAGTGCRWLASSQAPRKENVIQRSATALESLSKLQASIAAKQRRPSDCCPEEIAGMPMGIASPDCAEEVDSEFKIIATPLATGKPEPKHGPATKMGGWGAFLCPMANSRSREGARASRQAWSAKTFSLLSSLWKISHHAGVALFDHPGLVHRPQPTEHLRP